MLSAIGSTGWVGKQATERSTDPLTSLRHRRTAPCPPLVLSFDEVSIQYSVMFIRGNGVTLRTQKVIQGGRI